MSTGFLQVAHNLNGIHSQCKSDCLGKQMISVISHRIVLAGFEMESMSNFVGKPNDGMWSKQLLLGY